MQPLVSRVINSALWAAYGDALGFITELATTSTMIESRIGSSLVNKTVPWTRRIGGRFGTDCMLPAGCYSDDTQLRLATCRAIRSDGSFDVEAFAKMELPVWTGYSLGAGRGSKAAASALARDGVTWFSNFYQTQGISYVQGGGNGGAMRIQPHVWSLSSKADCMLLVEAITKNTICTHGHARGILGAVFHGFCLKYVLSNNSIPGDEDWRTIIDKLTLVASFVENDPDLKLIWLPVWEQRTKLSFRDACHQVQEELLHDVSILASIPISDPAQYYKNAVKQIGAMNERERGSATKTALLAAALSFAFGGNDVENALLTAANLLGSDTDSIASMAGALMGCLAKHPPTFEISDRAYIAQQAERAAKIALGEPVEHILYPDLMKWTPPRTQQDCVVTTNEGMEVLVLGRVIVEGETFSSKGDSGVWQWLSLESGQSILAKRKRQPSTITGDHGLTMKSLPSLKAQRFSLEAPQLEFFTNEPKEISSPIEVSIHELTRQAIRSGFNPSMIGEHILLLSGMPEGIEKSIAYTAIVTKARIARKAG